MHLKPKTLVGYESTLRVHVLPVFADRPVAAITYRDCKRFVDDLLHAGFAPGTVGEARKVLRLVLQEAVRADAIRRNPADGLRVPRGRRDEMVYLDADEVLALADAVATPPRPTRHAVKEWPAYSLLVRLAAFTGLRAGEVAALRVGRVNPMHGRLHVEESVAEVHGALVYGSPKTYSLRGVPIPAPLALDLVAHLATRPPDPAALVFTAPDGGPLRHSNFYRRYFKPAVGRCPIDPRTRFHDLRHTAAALMIADGAHLLAVKERLGHSTIQITADRYGHLFPSLEEALTGRLEATYTATLARRHRA
ncbi:MAG: site-specific integrase [Acidimicrobiales bacterium]|nr:site-specific integrase [Acidimicrobiales bacterium]